MDELKKKAVEKLQGQGAADFDSGYKRAIEMVGKEEISLKTAEELCSMDEPCHDVFEDKSKAYVDGFITGLREMLEKAREKGI